MDASLAKAKPKSKHWERDAKANVEKERDVAKKEAKAARLAVVGVGDAKARAEDDLTRARDA